VERARINFSLIFQKLQTAPELHLRLRFLVEPLVQLFPAATA
jgi:hypothetical protein